MGIVNQKGVIRQYFQYYIDYKYKWACMVAIFGAIIIGGLLGMGQWLLVFGFCTILLFIIIAWVNSWISLLIFLFIIPIVPQSFGFYMNGIPILLSIQRLLIIPLLGIWLIKKVSRRNWNSPPKVFFALILLYFGLTSLSSFIAPDTKAAFFRSVANYIEFIGLFIIINDLVISIKRIKTFLMTWVASSLLAFIFGLIEVLTGWNVVEKFSSNTNLVFWNTEDLGHGFQRAFSLFDHPISYSWFAALAFLAAVALLIMEKENKRKIIWFVAIIANSGSLVFSFGRTVILGFICAIILMIISMLPKQRFKFSKVVVICLFLLMLFFSVEPTFLEKRYTSLKEGLLYSSIENDNSWAVQGRLSLIDKGLWLIKSRPLGYGYTATSRNRDSAYFQKTFEGMFGFENHYILVMIETGIQGLISFLLPIFWLWRQTYLLIKNSAPFGRNDSWMLMIFFLSLIIFILIVFMGTSFLGNQEQLYWAILGLAGAFYGVIENEIKSTRFIHYSN